VLYIRRESIKNRWWRVIAEKIKVGGNSQSVFRDFKKSRTFKTSICHDEKGVGRRKVAIARSGHDGS